LNAGADAVLDAGIAAEGGRTAVIARGASATTDSAEAAVGLPILTLEQLREQANTVKWLVKHVVPAESIGVMFGGSGTFKSFIAIDLALHVAHGLPWLGKKTRQGKVLIVAAEGGAGLWRRIVAWHRENRLKWQDVSLWVLPVAVDLGTDAARVQDAMSALGVVPDLVVIDTLSQTFAGEENSASEVSAYLRELGVWFRSGWQASVLVVHHTGHQATERPRGSSAIRANVDFMFSVFRDEKEMLATVECVKQKDGELLDPTSFSLKVVELAKDEDGDSITSLVASGISDKRQVVSFMEHEAQRGRGGKNHLFLEMAQNGIEEKKLRAVFYEATDGDSEAKRKAYYRARKWAIDAGLLEVAQGVVIRLGDGTSIQRETGHFGEIAGHAPGHASRAHAASLEHEQCPNVPLSQKAGQDMPASRPSRPIPEGVAP
jgi:AAA domain